VIKKGKRMGWNITGWSDISSIMTIILCLVAIGTLCYAAKNYETLVKNTELTAKNTELTARNIELTHKPIVYIKGTLAPQDDTENPMKYGFIITNTGQLPAREVRVTCILNQVAGTNIGIDNAVSFPVLGKATIYPNNDLVFWIPEAIKWGQLVTKADATFSVYYSSEATSSETSETMKFVFSKETSYKWMYVGQEVDIFKEEREQIKKRMSQ
jgi:hypothetical protein